MGKKGKTGKQRKDKYYHLAKETGYRARSAFKLIQLNRKFGFLERSRCLIDLCAAPGGWLQVAAQFMPMSSVIIGVDLVAIRPIPKVITMQEDITSERCRQLLKKELHTWKADCVLNDGAPNVGSAWIQDAFSQAQLTLSALKLASEFLRPGGSFITKVFRSKDYQPLLWVFEQLFKKVSATKPQASRNESAEIFVVCQGYIAPDKLDPKFLDPKYIFEEVQTEVKKKTTMMQLEKPSKKADGYAENDYTLFKTENISGFLQSDSPLDTLASVNELVFDDEKYLNHQLTTDELKLCCKDIKVLGKADIRSLLSWHKSLKKEFFEQQTSEEKEEEPKEDEEEAIQKTIQSLQEEEDTALKRKKKKVQQEKRRLQERMRLKMILPGDTKDIQADPEMFSLDNIKSKRHLEDVDKASEDVALRRDEDSDDESVDLSEGDSDSSDEDEEEEDEDDDDDDDEEEEKKKKSEQKVENRPNHKEKNPLLVDLEPQPSLQAKTDMWFQKDAFKGLEAEEDEDLEISQMVEDYKRKGGRLLDGAAGSDTSKKAQKKDGTAPIGNPKKSSKGMVNMVEGEGSDSDSESDSESDSDYEMEAKIKQNDDNKSKGDSFEVVPAESSHVTKLDPEALALGAQMAFSRKRKRELEDAAYHRWAFNDNTLPSWFADEESKFYRRQLPVTKEQVDEYKARLREINARPVKKVAEAKARKKRKEVKRLEKARKKSEAIGDTVDVSEKEKMRQIKSLYKKASTPNKKEVKYVVTKKSMSAKRMKRPAGVTGTYKRVDPRMKKDLRAAKSKEKTKGRAKGRKKR